MVGPSSIFVFDAYGTLFDVHSAVREHTYALGDQATRVSDIWRSKQLEYTWIYCGTNRPAPAFRELTRRSLSYALSACGLGQELAAQILESYRCLKPFDEAPQALRTLKGEGAKLAILSNAGPEMLTELVNGAGLTEVFDSLISAHDVRTFKPSPRVYALAIDAFGCQPQDVTFVSSNRWDGAGAKAFGFSTVWVNRTSQADEYPDLAVDRSVSRLDQIVADRTK